VRTLRLLGTMAAIGLMASAANAQNPLISVKLTAMQQGPETVITNAAGNTYKNTVTKIKVLTRDILVLLEHTYGTNFPFGSQLSANDSGDFLVVDATGTNTILNVGNALNYEVDDEVFSGQQVNTPTGGQNVKVYQLTFINYDDTSTDIANFGLGGLQIAQYSENYSSGQTKLSFTMNVMGDGEINHVWSIITGTISGKGASR
jgi:hypothetical protein